MLRKTLLLDCEKADVQLKELDQVQVMLQGEPNEPKGVFHEEPKVGQLYCRWFGYYTPSQYDNNCKWWTLFLPSRILELWCYQWSFEAISDHWNLSGEFHWLSETFCPWGPAPAKSIQRKHIPSDCKILGARESSVKGVGRGGTPQSHPPPNTGEHPLPPPPPPLIEGNSPPPIERGGHSLVG